MVGRSGSRNDSGNGSGNSARSAHSAHGDGQVHIAAQHTQLPLDDFMTRLVAQEMPILDSTSRREVYAQLAAYDGPVITSQEELPARVRELLDL